MRTKQEIEAEIQKVQNNQFLPGPVKTIKLKKLNEELGNTTESKPVTKFKAGQGSKMTDADRDAEVKKRAAKKSKKVKEPKPKKEKKVGVHYKYKGKVIKNLTQEDCDELRKDVSERRTKQAKAEKKSKSKPVVEKVAGNVATAVKQAIKNVSAADIKDDPKGEIDKMKLIAIEAKKFVAKIKSILGSDYDAAAVKDEFKEIDILIKELEKKYK